MKKTYYTPRLLHIAAHSQEPVLISLSKYADDSDAKVKEESWTDPWICDEMDPTPYALSKGAEE